MAVASWTYRRRDDRLAHREQAACYAHLTQEWMEITAAFRAGQIAALSMQAHTDLRPLTVSAERRIVA